MKVALLALFVFGLWGSCPIMRADSFPSTPGFFTTVDIPGASSTSINAISSSGNNLAGTFNDSTGLHAFIDKHGVFTKFDFPADSVAQAVTGVNDSGQVVGNYVLPDQQSIGLGGRGFLYANGVVSVLTDQFGSPNNLFAQGINNAGEISGYTRVCTIDVICQSGFVYSNGNVTTYRFPLPDPFTADTFFGGINNNGEIVGSYSAGIPHQGYRYGGAFIFLGDDAFMSYNVPGATHSGAAAINDAGQIVGGFVDSNSNPHFSLDSNGSISTLDFSPTGISNSGQIVGGGDFVFTATPEPASLVLFGSGLAAIGLMIRRRR